MAVSYLDYLRMIFRRVNKIDGTALDSSPTAGSIADELDDIIDYTKNIDDQATLGLAGTSNSLAYRVHEIEKHFHSIERWYGNDTDGTGSVANNSVEWELAAHADDNDTYGTEVLMLAANDVLDADFGITVVKFDLHRIRVSKSNSNDQNYMIQIWSGTGTFGEATLRTEIPYRSPSNAGEVAPINAQMSRIPVAEKVWGRVKCEIKAKTLEIIVGIHAYAG